MSARYALPRRMVVLAAALGALYGAAHAAGLRSCASFLSGTASAGGGVALGILYVALHFAFVIGAPTLVLAGAMLAAYEARRARNEAERGRAPIHRD